MSDPLANLLEKLSNPEIFLDVINGFALIFVTLLLFLLCLENLARIRYRVNFQENINKILNIFIIPLLIFFLIIIIMTNDIFFILDLGVVLGFLILNYLIKKEIIKTVKDKKKENRIRFIYFTIYFAAQFAIFHYTFFYHYIHFFRQSIGFVALSFLFLNLALFLLYLKSYQKPIKLEEEESL